MSALPSSKKTHSEKHKQILRSLLREGSNKTCADCKTATHPRWASWNLGCFVCIRCSGIHRSMGTHISKVKSVDLDAWTDEQVDSMLRWGNDKCNAYWEAKLPAAYVPDQSKIENFIRTKYDMRKWVASPSVPDPSTLSAQPQPQAPAPAQSKEPAPAPAQSKAPAPAPAQSKAPAPPIQSRSAAPTQSKPASKTGLSSFDDEFGLFTSSSSPKSLPNLTEPRASSTPPAAANSRPDLKKSILSLYSTPSSSSSSITQKTGPEPSVSALGNSLNGLNFGNPQPTTNSPAASSIGSAASRSPVHPVSQIPTQTAPQTKSWNEWSDSWTKPTTSNLSTDDDLFKNVWS